MAARGYAAEVARGDGGLLRTGRAHPGLRRCDTSARRRAPSGGVSLEPLERLAPDIAESEAKAASLVDVYRRYLEGRADRYDGDGRAGCR